jgi:NAD(P)-dependent dehydrogenase (short-subunit alcohol dehydrogenase family)
MRLGRPSGTLREATAGRRLAGLGTGRVMAVEETARGGPGHERSLTGRVALVTGGTRGIGAAIARSLADWGAVVAAGYRSNDEAAQRFLSDLIDSGAEGSVHLANVAGRGNCGRVVSEVLDRHGRLDILVNNAGITSDEQVLKMEEDQWYNVLGINLSGTFFMTQASLPHMLERGSGRIVNISSVTGERGNIGQANYAAAAAAIFGLTKTLARESAMALAKSGKLAENPIGVTVNCVAPGYIESEMVARIPSRVLDRVRTQIPLGRLGHVDDVANAVGFFCDDATSYVTGQVLNVNGGLDM